jgi:hypothetical protein
VPTPCVQDLPILSLTFSSRILKLFQGVKAAGSLKRRTAKRRRAKGSDTENRLVTEFVD